MAFQLLRWLGRQIDAVNIVDADVAVVTAIGLDHQEWLGSDVETIAIEKCGIARDGRACVVADSRHLSRYRQNYRESALVKYGRCAITLSATSI